MKNWFRHHVHWLYILVLPFSAPLSAQLTTMQKQTEAHRSEMQMLRKQMLAAQAADASRVEALVAELQK